MTLRAWRGQMRSGECESRGGVVERCRLPGGRVMAKVTSLREARCHMIGVRRSVEIRDVTTRAHERQGCEVVVHVTQRARGGEVRAGQWERGLGVVECGRLPSGRVVAHFAGLRESGRHMIGTRRLVEIRHVAAGALSRYGGIVVVQVAQRALHCKVRPSQWERGLGMVECRRLPGGRGVAHIAGLRESGRHMIGIRRLVEIRHVAA